MQRYLILAPPGAGKSTFLAAYYRNELALPFWAESTHMIDGDLITTVRKVYQRINKEVELGQRPADWFNRDTCPDAQRYFDNKDRWMRHVFGELARAGDAQKLSASVVLFTAEPAAFPSWASNNRKQSVVWLPRLETLKQHHATRNAAEPERGYLLKTPEMVEQVYKTYSDLASSLGLHTFETIGDVINYFRTLNARKEYHFWRSRYAPCFQDWRDRGPGHIPPVVDFDRWTMSQARRPVAGGI